MNTTRPALKPSRADLSARFAKYRRNVRLGAVALVSLSTLRALSAVEQREATRIARSVYAQGRTDDGDTAQTLPEGQALTDRAARSPLLSPGERNALAAAMGRAPRSLVLRKVATVTDGEADEPLPPGYVPAPVAPYESAFLNANDPEVRAIETAAAIEAGIEIAARERWDALNAAAVAFVSDYAAHPEDHAPYAAPLATRPAPSPISVLAPQTWIARATAPVTLAPTGNPITDHAALLAAVLGKSSPRRVTFRA